MTKIYGPTIVERLLEKNKLKFNKNIIDELNSYQRISEDGCTLCRNLYKDITPNKAKSKFNERNMDFPSWLGDLSNSKDVILLGESITSSLQDDKNLKKSRIINLAFQLGTLVYSSTTLDDIINSGSKSKTKQFWNKINLFFKGNSDNWLKKLYITDCAKCNADKNYLMGIPCGIRYLVKEIEFIKPKIILIQGRIALEIFYTLIQSSEKYEIILSKKLPNISNDKYDFYNSKKYSSISRGTLINKELNFRSDFLCIPHTAPMNSRYSYPGNQEFWKELGSFLQNEFSNIFIHN